VPQEILPLPGFLDEAVDFSLVDGNNSMPDRPGICWSLTMTA
jgi:hypothetical protein